MGSQAFQTGNLGRPSCAPTSSRIMYTNQTTFAFILPEDIVLEAGIRIQF
jgi:hypothetical protein